MAAARASGAEAVTWVVRRRKLRARIYFLEDWPRCIIFFMRMLQILRGLCISVDAEGMPMLQIFSSHAKAALQEGSQKQLLSSHLRIYAGREGRKRGDETPFCSKVTMKRNAALEARMQKTLADLLSRRQIVGAQVAVVCAGELVCSVAAGTLSSIDARPVEDKTRFPLLGATAGLGALAFLRALHRQSEELIAATGDDKLKLGTLLRKIMVSQIWPDFAAGRSDLCLADLLAHRAGLQDAYPIDFSPSSLDDLKGMAAHLEADLAKPSEESRYAYLLQSFVLAKLGNCIGGQDDFLHWLGEELGSLGLDVALPAGSDSCSLSATLYAQKVPVLLYEGQASKASKDDDEGHANDFKPQADISDKTW
ncbi:unnamed protein product [Symbiodinium natans]|uniref:Beta-lactamase-related domain-containing protein n=1 Tax=Symbiodinium natans TaxID=878477 RepID=A0A812NSR5_9DINO|nr:unnamed protein product [Symbiodinium natans]